MTTLYVTHPRYPEHDDPTHPEHAGRIRAVWKAIEDGGLLPRMTAVEPDMIDEESILAVHTPAHVALLNRLPELTRTSRLDADTYAGPTSYEIARLSAGGVVRAVDAVLRGDADNALAAVRPPGHHAMPDYAMGFCLLGNVAIAARYAQRQFDNVARIAIVDFDVHHGNGTEAMFYDDASVLFISTHQYPLYPGTGALTDTGANRGEGCTINLPMPPHCGDTNYAAVFDKVILPAVERFAPDLLIVSAGFDAHWADPLALMNLSLTGFAALSQRMIDLAGRVCGGRIVFAMEGGYNLDALAGGMSNVARLLIGEAAVDTMGLPPHAHQEPTIVGLIERARTLHRLT